MGATHLWKICPSLATSSTARKWRRFYVFIPLKPFFRFHSISNVFLVLTWICICIYVYIYAYLSPPHLWKTCPKLRFTKHVSEIQFFFDFTTCHIFPALSRKCMHAFIDMYYVLFHGCTSSTEDVHEPCKDLHTYIGTHKYLHTNKWHDIFTNIKPHHLTVLRRCCRDLAALAGQLAWHQSRIHFLL